jgi:hypothetical protein
VNFSEIPTPALVEVIEGCVVDVRSVIHLHYLSHSNVTMMLCITEHATLLILYSVHVNLY